MVFAVTEGEERRDRRRVDAFVDWLDLACRT